MSLHNRMLKSVCAAVAMGAGTVIVLVSAFLIFIATAHAQQQPQPQRPSDEQIDARIQSFSVQVQNATNEVILMREQIIMLSAKLKKAEDELAAAKEPKAEKK